MREGAWLLDRRQRSGFTGSNCQAVSSLGPATIDDGTTIFGLHSDPKSMGPVSFGVAGLKGSFAHYRLSSFNLEGVLPGLSVTRRKD